MANWSAEQMANARLIVAVGLEMRMSSRDILIGIMTAMQESSLKNVRYGDRDSLGLFQQRPSQGWGSPGQVTDPLYATRKFFTTLKGVGNRGNMQLWQAAQAVQRSGNPTAFGNWENDARRMMNGMGQNGGLPYPVNVPKMDLSLYGGLATPEPQAKSPGTTMGGVSSIESDKASPATPGAGGVLGEITAPQQPQPEMAIDPAGLGMGNGEFPNLQNFVGGGARATIVKAAMKMIGTPYSWGGGTARGKSFGIQQGANINGFDCSGLVLYAMAQAGIKMPRIAADQATVGTKADVKSLQPGDLLVKPNGGHIAIYVGGGKMIEAPYTGARVRLVPVRKDLYGVHLNIGGGGKLTSPGTASGTIQGPDQGSPTTELPPGIEIPQMPTPLMNFPGL